VQAEFGHQKKAKKITPKKEAHTCQHPTQVGKKLSQQQEQQQERGKQQ
jgi:hypothetical protein